MSCVRATITDSRNLQLKVCKTIKYKDGKYGNDAVKYVVQEVEYSQQVRDMRYISLFSRDINCDPDQGIFNLYMAFCAGGDLSSNFGRCLQRHMITLRMLSPYVRSKTLQKYVCRLFALQLQLWLSVMGSRSPQAWHHFRLIISSIAI